MSENNNIGNHNIGICNIGYRNTGSWNIGHYNTGDFNTGNQNTGYSNTGFGNTGDRNVGHWNIGNCNTGILNMSNYNTGHFNTSDYNTGCFNTIEFKIMLFNKPSDMTLKEWEASDAYTILKKMPTQASCVYTEHIAKKRTRNRFSTCDSEQLTQEALFEQRQHWFDRLVEEDKEIILSIPNFDAEIFKQCTGIDVEMEDK